MRFQCVEWHENILLSTFFLVRRQSVSQGKPLETIQENLRIAWRFFIDLVLILWHPSALLYIETLCFRAYWSERFSFLKTWRKDKILFDLIKDFGFGKHSLMNNWQKRLENAQNRYSSCNICIIAKSTFFWWSSGEKFCQEIKKIR